jgi:predicted nucleotidyltransferase
MKVSSFEALATVLQNAGVRYLVAGGLAVGAHGHLRFTKDVDLVIELVPDNIERAFAALTSLGYRPSVPVSMQQFATVSVRESWVRDKGMQVLQFWSDAHRETSVDVFVSEPFVFEEEYGRALVKPLHDTLPIRFVSLETLIDMKQKAGRPEDLTDIQQLRILLQKTK